MQEISDTDFKDALLELSNIDASDLDAVFEKITMIASKTLNTPYSSIWICQESTSILECIAQCSTADIELNNYISCTKIRKYKTPFVVELESKEFSEYFATSVLVTPLIVRNKLIGVLVHSSTFNAAFWDEKKISFSIAIANSVSLYLEIQKNSIIQQQLIEFTKLLDVSQTIVIQWENKENWPVKYITDNISQFGYDSQNFINREMSYFSIIYKDDIRRLMVETIKYMKEGVDAFSQVYRIVTSKGILRWVDVRVIAERNKIDEVVGYLGTINDITYLVEKEQKVELLAKALEQTNQMVFIVNRDGIITYANDAVSEQSGYSADELIGQKPSVFKSGKHDSAFYERMWKTILSGENYSNIIINKKKNNQIVYVDINITPILDTNGEVKNFVATYKDVTIQMKLEQKLENLATTDSLTQIYNRYKINIEMDKYIARTKRYGSPFSLLMFDIDHFKEVNDTYGHYVGDVVLKDLTGIVKQNIRQVDGFGRWGGEEFMLILENATREKALKIAEKIKNIISITMVADHYKITVSIGVSEYHQDEQKSALLKRVDEALYEAKENGRNQVRFK